MNKSSGYLRLFCLFFSLLLAFSSFLPVLASGTDTEPEPLKTVSDDTVDELLINFKKTVEKTRKNDILELEALEVTNEIPQLNTVVVKLPANRSAEQMQSLVSKYSGVIEAVEPNYTVSAGLVPNDELYGRMNLLLTSIEAAWDISYSADVVVAVLDTGVTFSHPDMVGRFAGTGYDFVNNDSDATDDHGHGTQVAGMIGANGNNKKGVAGVNWGVRILPVKVMGSDARGSVDKIANGMYYAMENGARIINLSIGLSTSSATLKKVMDEAYARGVVVVAASGNDSKPSIWYPAGYDTVIAVGSGNASGRYDYSNYGSGLTVIAPGGHYSTSASGGYVNCSGTSFAAPVIAGVLSLAMGIYPDMTPDDAMLLISESCKDIGGSGYDTTNGWGFIDPELLLKNARTLASLTKPTVTPTPETSPSPTLTPTPTPMPSPTPTPTPTPSNEIRVFTGKIGDKNSPQAYAHKFLFNNDGVITATATWSGNGQARFLIVDKNQTVLDMSDISSSPASISYTLPSADEYWIVLQAKDQKNTIKYTINASFPYLTSDLGQDEIALEAYPIPASDADYTWVLILSIGILCLGAGVLLGRYIKISVVR